MDIKNLDKEFLVEFIEAYRQLPCLWRIKSSEYKDRNKKNRAYEELLSKYKKVDSTATLQMVKTKIDSLRGSFRKEIKKIKESQRSGAGEDEIYKPHLWYYGHLLFLLDQETPRESISSLDTEYCSESATNDIQEDEVLSPRSERFLESEESTSNQSSLTLCTPISSPSMIKSNTTKVVRPNQKRKLNKADEVLEKVSQQLEYAKEDKFDIIGKNLANKLRELPYDVAIITEKMFNDIVFEAQMGNVTRHTKVKLQDTSNNALRTHHTSFMPVLQSVENIHSELSQQNSVQRQQYYGERDAAEYYKIFSSEISKKN